MTVSGPALSPSHRATKPPSRRVRASADFPLEGIPSGQGFLKRKELGVGCVGHRMTMPRCNARSKLNQTRPTLERQPFRSMGFVSVIIVSVLFALGLPLVLLSRAVRGRKLVTAF